MSCVNLSNNDCFVLTQDDVRGGGLGGSGHVADSASHVSKQQQRRLVDELAAAPPRAKPAVARSKTTVTPPRGRTKNMAASSTWLDDAGQSDDDDDRNTDDASFDFHFGLGSSSAKTQQPSQKDDSASDVASEFAGNVSRRPVALVQPHKVTGIRVIPDELNANLLSRSQQPKPTKTPVSLPSQDVDECRSRPTSMSSSLRDQLRAGPATSSLGRSFKVQKSPAPTKPVAVDTRPSSDQQPVLQASRPPTEQNATRPFMSDVKPRPSNDPPFQPAGAEMSSKEKEIASAIGDMKLDFDASAQNTLSAHGTNFEKCLGYFP